MSEYDDTIEYLYNLKRFGMNLGLERIQHLMDLLGNPQDDLNVIHVAGTNGKGSVCAMLSSILQSAGYKVGLFTSPHLVSFTERITINDEQMPEDRMLSLVKRIRPHVEEFEKDPDLEHPTFFEFVTAMAFIYFCEEKVDWAVLEVGLGGRLDATNIVTPKTSIITNVDFDHTHVLGTELDVIAQEKAGIIKPGVPVVTSIEDDSLLKALREKCEDKSSELHILKNFAGYTLKQATLDNQVFDVNGMNDEYHDLKLSLLGKHQLTNALAAIKTVELLKDRGLEVTKEHIKKGLESTKWPGRFEIICKEPMVVLDCAHNPGGMRSFRSTLEELLGEMDIVLVIGTMRDKDIPSMIGEIAPIAKRVIITKSKLERAADPVVLKDEISKYCDDIIIKENISEAVNYAVESAKKNEAVCIAGSIFIIGEVKENLGGKIRLECKN